MGLTNHSVGRGAVDTGLSLHAQTANTRVIALAGNPNVGKSTVFNALTGLHQHTGNWPGKTVTNAQGHCSTDRYDYLLVDIPGTYSLFPHSAEEEVARDFICFEQPDAVVVVCDATCLERNLNLALQIIETGVPAILCVNLMDEAHRRQIHINLPELEKRLGIPVVRTIARKKKTLQSLLHTLDRVMDGHSTPATPIVYPPAVEQAIAHVQPLVEEHTCGHFDGRWLSLRLLDPVTAANDAELYRQLPPSFKADATLETAITQQRQVLAEQGLIGDAWQDCLVTAIVKKAHALCEGVVTIPNQKRPPAQRRIDRLDTSRRYGYPLMLLLLAFVFWLTIQGANIPSHYLSIALFWGQEQLTALFHHWGAPEWLHGALVLGAYRVLAWVVSVMLPPMAIFFPLFTLLEDAGFLPRIAYNLDRPFHRCRACGKQALTMCMGFGCNAAGVVGCRIIDSPRERLLAILTNSFVPCNGRFPTLLTLITLFFIGGGGGGVAALLLTAVVLLGVLATFGMTRLLADTLLRGTPSSYVLELPPYRRPQIGQVIVRSLWERTVFVLGRAAAVAAPAGLLIWLLANISLGGQSLLAHGAALLDTPARWLGLDGAILLAFILGFPANEIVLPLTLTIYLAQGSLTDIGDVALLRQILVDNGWTWHTAASTILFSLFHWPCSTTLLTIRKETGSWRWTLIAALLPTALGVLVCGLLTTVVRCFG